MKREPAIVLSSLIFFLVGSVALFQIYSIGMKPFHFVMAVVIVLLMGTSPYMLSGFGFRLGERVPLDPWRVFLLECLMIFVFLVFSGSATTSTDIFFGQLLTRTFMFPAIALPGLLANLFRKWHFIGQSTIIIFLVSGFIFAYAILKCDRRLVRKAGKTERSGEN